MANERIEAARTPETLWVEIPSQINRTRVYRHTNGSGRVETVQIQSSLVAAIRADVAEDVRALVKAAQAMAATGPDWALKGGPLYDLRAALVPFEGDS